MTDDQKKLLEARNRRWDESEASMDAILTKHGIDPNKIRCGAQCGIGWHPLIDALITDLIALGWDKQIEQIKEKFGGLRFYIGNGDDAVWSRIDTAESASYRICEDCGGAGKARDGGWVRTLCGECDENQKKAKLR